MSNQKILVAKCRLGHPCRYHGRSVESPSLKRNIKNKNYTLFCPEMDMGLPVPRQPIRKKDGKFYYEGEDITDKLKNYSLNKAKVLADEGFNIFIGVKNSPCCDPGQGIFSRCLAKNKIQTLIFI